MRLLISMGRTKGYPNIYYASILTSTKSMILPGLTTLEHPRLKSGKLEGIKQNVVNYSTEGVSQGILERN